MQSQDPVPGFLGPRNLLELGSPGDDAVVGWQRADGDQLGVRSGH